MNEDFDRLSCRYCGCTMDRTTICAQIMGDDYTETVLSCSECSLYYLLLEREPFSLEGEGPRRSELDAETALRKIELIRRCENPFEKGCRCQAHRDYWGAFL